jgi:hypothetical protein
MAKEEFMVVSTSVRTHRKTGETIEIELPLERSEFRLLKVAWHDLCHKFLGLMNGKGPSVRMPRNNVRQSFLFNILQHNVKNFGERMCDTSARTTSFVISSVGTVAVIIIPFVGMIMVFMSIKDLVGSRRIRPGLVITFAVTNDCRELGGWD